MSNHYNANQQWDQTQIYYTPQNLPLEPGVAFDPYSEPQYNQQQQQQAPQRQLPSYTNSYQYPQNPPNSSIAPSSSLQGALQTNQHASHSRASSYTNSPPQPNSASNPYAHTLYSGSSSVPSFHNNAPTFTFGATNISAAASAMTGIDTSGGSGASNFLTTSPEPLRETFAHTLTRPLTKYYPSSSIQGSLSSNPAKRARPEPNDEAAHEDPESEGGPSDSKESNKVKPTRACARCKNLKVKCEVKTEGDPCKRCLNGAHDCFIPGRKVRRVPPKREHLISQIQSQAKEIERLMTQLESLTAVKQEASQENQTRQTTPSVLHSPVLSPSTTDSYAEADASTQNTGEPANAATNKAIEDWIAKTRENMQELSFICVGGAGVPESYIVEGDFEDPNSSGDEDFVDVPEEPGSFGDGEDRYEVAVEDPEGSDFAQREGGASRGIHHKLSHSSIGTTKSAGTQNQNRKKGTGDHDKPVNLPVEASPFGLFGKMSLKARPRSRAGSDYEEEEDKGPGIANQNFFRPSPAPESFVRQMYNAQQQVPAILAKAVITPLEAEKLFQIYYQEMNLSVSLLDPILYDAKRTFWRSPFLFTVICGIASRFYSERPELYQQAMHYAQLAAGTALISGAKNVEMCAAYILLSLYPIPVKRWEHQRSWLYLGLAIRTATDLNLHLPITAKPMNENHAREMLNRTRIWLNCFNLDRSTGSQYGKPPIISNHDYTANHSEDWWRSSPQNLQHFDIHICAYNAELRLMSNFIAKIYSDPHHPTGLNKEVDFEGIATETDDELQRLQQRWFSILDQTDMSDPQNCFRTGLLRLAYSYARLIALSYGFQHAFGKNDGQDENPFLTRCLNAASDVVNAVVNDICRPSQRHYFRHGPEAQSVFVTFASAFLVKLLQPKFASYLTHEKRVQIRQLVQSVVDLLSSDEIAIDDRHGPKLYSKFLRNLLAKPLARIDSTSDINSPNPPRSRSRGAAKSSSRQNSRAPASADSQSSVFNAPSPATSGSLSPPPAESMTDFNNFRPVGGVDPYAPDAPIMNAFNGASDGAGDMLMSDYFQPELPFDEEIVRSIQDLADPSGWQDISMPVGFNWMTQFQQNLGLDLRSAPSDMFTDTQQHAPYLTGASV